jgi:branched-chain amino acid transport system substrate-binding protein
VDDRFRPRRRTETVNVRRLAACAALAGVALGAGSVRAATPAPFEIPVIVSLTGSGAALGSAEAQSLRLLAESVNRSGGVRGRPIAFTVQDDQSSPQVAVQLANGVIAQHPPIVVATTLVSGCSAVLPLLANGPVTYCLSPGMYPPKDSYMFAYGAPTKNDIRMEIEFYHQHGWNRIAAIFTADATGQDFERNLDAALALPENRDVTVVARERFSTSDVSVGAQIASIKAAAPQAVIAWATGTPIGTIFHGLNDLGLDVPTITNAANLNYNVMRTFRQVLPKDLYFISYPGIAPDAVPPGPLRRAAAAYADALKSAGIPPDSNHLIAWDPGTVIVGALKALGLEATPAAYKQYIENLHGYFGACGEYDFRDGSQHGLDGRNDLVLRYDAVKEQFTAVARIGSAYSSR